MARPIRTALIGAIALAATVGAIGPPVAAQTPAQDFGALELGSVAVGEPLERCISVAPHLTPSSSTDSPTPGCLEIGEWRSGPGFCTSPSNLRIVEGDAFTVADVVPDVISSTSPPTAVSSLKATLTIDPTSVGSFSGRIAIDAMCTVLGPPESRTLQFELRGVAVPSFSLDLGAVPSGDVRRFCVYLRSWAWGAHPEPPAGCIPVPATAPEPEPVVGGEDQWMGQVAGSESFEIVETSLVGAGFDGYLIVDYHASDDAAAAAVFELQTRYGGFPNADIRRFELLVNSTDAPPVDVPEVSIVAFLLVPSLAIGATAAWRRRCA